MMRGLPVDGYEIIKAITKKSTVALFFSMKLVGANSGDSIQQLTRSMRGIQTLAPWQGSPEWSFPIFRITSCSEARAG
jgi:hypothetical protein